jgi:hypothetical protein
MKTFAKDKLQIIEGALDTKVCRLLAEEFRLIRNIALATNKMNPDYRHPKSKTDNFPFADEMVDNSFSWYSPVCFEALSTTIMKDIVEEVVGETVFPTYSYARIYSNGSEMQKHIDRTSSEFSVSCCLETDNKINWPLGFELESGEILEVLQKPGDIVIYDGSKLPHWRKSFSGTEHINAFMFYVMENGPRSILKYDTRPYLGYGPHTRSLDSEQQFEKFNILQQ